MTRTALWGLLLLMASGSMRAAAQEPAAESFDIWEFRVLGNTVLEPIEVERAVYPHLGPARSLTDVEAARKALEEVYKGRGYGTVFLDIPEQDVGEGIVRLKVTEGRIDRVRIVGARYFSSGRIRSAVPTLAEDKVPSLPVLQDELNALNSRTPDRVITPILKAGRTPGTIDAELRVADELPVHGSLELSDRYTANTSRLRASAALSYDNLFQRFHSLQLQFQTAPEEPDENRVLSATYVAPLGSSRNAIAAYIVDTNSDVASVGALSVLGTGRIYGARLIAQLSSGESFSSSLSFGADYKDFEENVRLTAEDSFNTPIDYLQWSAAYSAGYFSERVSTGVSISANFGLRRVIDDTSEFGMKRAYARSNYFYLRGSGQIEKPVFAGFRLYARLGGQFTTQPLINNEQFFIGGADSVRGYPEALQLGDYGYNATFELRSPDLGPRLWAPLRSLYVLSFFDAGLVSILEPLPQQTDRFDLSSVGAGLRLTALDQLVLGVDWAYPLVPSADVLDGDSRWSFLVRYAY